MEAKKDICGMLDLLIRPGFCVRNDHITYANPPAQALLLQPGLEIRELLLTCREEYAAFREGCLYLQLNIAGGCGASVFPMDGGHIFLLDQQEDDDALRAMALAARELREPLSAMQLAISQLSPEQESHREPLARLNRGIYRMLRILGNMSDAGRRSAHPEVRDIPGVFDGIFEKAQALALQAGMTLDYRKETGSVLGLADESLLERAVWNLLSNAIKFSPAGSVIHSRLSRSGRMLKLSITDSGSGIAPNLQQTLFQRYLRQPGIEDGRFGLGLGMVLVRSAAAAHGGTILIDQPEAGGTRVTLTFPIRQDPGTLRSPVIRVDYSGEQDHGLVELADCLPLMAYYKE